MVDHRFHLTRELIVKGPGMRLDYDVRRRWNCPVCGAIRRTSGDTTAVTCWVCSDHPLMKLDEPAQSLRPHRTRLDLVIALHPDDVDAPPFVPAHLACAAEAPAAPAAPLNTETQPAEAALMKSQPDVPSSDRSGKRPGRRRARKGGGGGNPTQSQTAGSGPASVDQSPPLKDAAPGQSSGSDAFGDGVLEGP